MEYHLLSDALLVKLLLVNDSGAFNEVYKRYWKELFMYAQRKIKSDEVIEDLLQNTFLSIWEKRADQPIDNLGGYLFNTLKYQIMDYYRKQFLVEKHADFVVTKLEQHDPGPEGVIHFQDIKAIFDQALQQLPEKTSRIFYLSRLEHKTTREIGQMLDMPERTVEYHITQALKLLRDELKDFLPIVFILFFYPNQIEL